MDLLAGWNAIQLFVIGILFFGMFQFDRRIRSLEKDIERLEFRRDV